MSGGFGSTCTSVQRQPKSGKNDAAALPSPPHVQMMDTLRVLEEKLQRLDDRLASLSADASGSSQFLARRLDDIAGQLAELGLGGGEEGAQEPLAGCSPPMAVAPVAAPDFLAGTFKQQPEDSQDRALKSASAPGDPPGEGNTEAIDDILRLESGISSVDIKGGVPSAKKWKGSAVKLLQQSDNIPPRIKRINQIVEVTALVSIALNTLLMMVQLQFEGHELGVGMGVEIGPWPDIGPVFLACEHVFNFIFVIELVVRVATFKMRFFYNHRLMKFNIFDFVLIIATSVDLYIARSVGSGESSKLLILRFVRFIRLARVLRMFGAMKFFMPLRLMLSVIGHSFSAMVWHMALMWVVMLTAAILLCQTAQSSIKENQDISKETREWVFELYGTTLRSMWTLIQLTFSGGWPQYAHRMVDEVNSSYAIFFFAYVFAVTFALFRIVTALLVQDTMEQAGRDAQLAVQQKMQQKERMSHRLLDFFLAADTSGDGVLTSQEFHRILENEKVKTWLSMMDLSLHETEELFSLLAGSDGVVSFKEFTTGICRMKGPARSEDVMVIKNDQQRLQETTRREFESVQRSLDELRWTLTSARIVRPKSLGGGV